MKAGKFTLWAVPLIFLLIFYFYPLSRILEFSIEEDWLSGVSDANWRIISHAISFTVYQALASTMITLIVGIPAAYLFGRYDFRVKGFLRIATTLPFILPTVVVAAGFNALVGPRGWLNLLLMNIMDSSIPVIQIFNTLSGILLAHVFYNTSIVLRVLGTAWEQLDPRLEDAARMLGASSSKVFSRITLPLLIPPLISATLLVFLFNFTSFGVILLMGGVQFSTIELEIYIQTMHFLNLPLASFLAIIQLCFSIIVSLILVQKSTHTIVPTIPRVKGEGVKRPQKCIQKVFLTVWILLLISLLVLPVASLIVRSFITFDESSTQITLNFYRSLFMNQRQSIFYVPPITALRNSILFAVVASLISLVLGIMIAYSKNTGNRRAELVEMLMLLPLGTSAVTMGLGLLIAFTRGQTSAGLYPILIPIAHSLIALPFVVRILEPAITSIPMRLKWAASSLGASPGKVWRLIELPLTWRAFTASAVYAFTISLGEFGATSFLTRPEFPTMPVAIFRYLNLPGNLNYGQALAMSVIMLLVSAGGMAIIDRSSMVRSSE
jgi:thiamine transport system permease protein